VRFDRSGENTHNRSHSKQLKLTNYAKPKKRNVSLKLENLTILSNSRCRSNGDDEIDSTQR